MDILLHDDNNLFMFIKSRNLITRNLTPKQQQQPQQQQNPPPKAHNLLILEGWAKSQFFKSQKQLLGLYWKKPYR